MSVKNSQEIRDAHSKMLPKIVELNQKVGQKAEIFDALNHLKETPVIWNSLDPTQQRIINNSIKNMRLSGLGLNEEDKKKFNELENELADLTTKFSNNVLDSTKEFKFRYTNKEDLEGLPLSHLALLSQNAKQEGDVNSTPEEGPWVITLSIPSYLPCMKHLKNREIREKLYKSYISIASEDKFTNIPLISRILSIKKQTSSLLGYPNYAALSLDTKMAKDKQEVMNLLEMLREKSYPYALRDYEKVKEFAKANGFTEEIRQWDMPFWSERLFESEYEYKEEDIKPYFSLPLVLNGLFTLCERLFSIKIKESTDPSITTWHEDVKYYNIYDSNTNEYVASFYLDPYSRPSEKKGGAWMNECLGRSKVLNYKPVAYLVCNGSPPVGEKPSLMTFRDVETLFHEFGHGLQHMLTKVEHGDASGIRGIEWDAVELPSQFMENWCLDEPTLFSFAKHYETGEPLPYDLFQKIKKSKNFQSGLAMIRQLLFGVTDLTLYSSYDPLSYESDSSNSPSPFDIYHELAPQYTVITPLPNDYFLCSFSHIFAGGYSAGYYSYKWAEVMSADAFAAFEEVGLENEEQVRETGKKFKDTVLALGGGTHPAEVYRLFRGRDPLPDALLRHSGLDGKTPNDEL